MDNSEKSTKRMQGIFDGISGDAEPEVQAVAADEESADFDRKAFEAEFEEINTKESENVTIEPFNSPPEISEAPHITASEQEEVTSQEPLPAYETKESSEIQTQLQQLGIGVSAIADSSAKTALEIREMHKLYHNEFAKRLLSMQEELERYREIDKGRAFDGILGDVAKLYADNESLLENIEDVKLKKRLGYMFMDILQILEANGVSKQKSEIGDKRNTKYCQVVERKATDNPALHDTVAKSLGTGFYIENRPLIKEPVDVYLISENNAEEPAKE